MDPWLVWPRALVVGLLAVTLGTTGHVTADGLLPGAAPMTALAVVSVVLAAPLLVRRASPLRLVAMLAGGQAGIHLVLTTAAGHRGDHATPHPSPVTPALPARSGEPTLPVEDGRRIGSLYDAYAQAAASPSAAPPTAGDAAPWSHLLSDLASHAPMMAAHLAAAGALALWLARGERALWDLLVLATHRILTPPALAALVPSTTCRVRPDRAAVPILLPSSVWQSGACGWRGPPAAA